MENGQIGMVPAWRSIAYRVPAEKFETILTPDPTLEPVIKTISQKIEILNFQHEAYLQTENKLSTLLQQVVDEEKLMTIAPRTLDGLFQVCFILEHMNKIPKNSSLWLVYSLSFLDENLNSEELFKLVYIMDFLYMNTPSMLQDNELRAIVESLQRINALLRSFERPDGSYSSDPNLSPLEETRNALFTINIIEDLTQDILHYYGSRPGLKPITKIYQTIENLDRVWAFISGVSE